MMGGKHWRRKATTRIGSYLCLSLTPTHTVSLSHAHTQTHTHTHSLTLTHLWMMGEEHWWRKATARVRSSTHLYAWGGVMINTRYVHLFDQYVPDVV